MERKLVCSERELVAFSKSILWLMKIHPSSTSILYWLTEWVRSQMPPTGCISRQNNLTRHLPASPPTATLYTPLLATVWKKIPEIQLIITGSIHSESSYKTKLLFVKTTGIIFMYVHSSKLQMILPSYSCLCRHRFYLALDFLWKYTETKQEKLESYCDINGNILRTTTTIKKGQSHKFVNDTWMRLTKRDLLP